MEENVKNSSETGNSLISKQTILACAKNRHKQIFAIMGVYSADYPGLQAQLKLNFPFNMKILEQTDSMIRYKKHICMLATTGLIDFH